LLLFIIMFYSDLNKITFLIQAWRMMRDENELGSKVFYSQ